MTYAWRNNVEHFRFQDVCTGINVFASRFVRFGLLEKTSNTSDTFSFHDAVGTRIFDRCQDDGTERIAILVFTNDGFQMQASEDNAVEDNGGSANQIFGTLVRTRSAHRLQLDRALKLHTKLGTVADM